MNEAAQIQMDSKLPINVISQLHSMKEYEVYKSAGLKTMMVNGRMTLVPNIDYNYVTKLPDGTEVTNRMRMRRGLPAIEPATGLSYEVHHVGQKNDGVLAVLTRDQHREKGAFGVLHEIWKDSEVVNSGTEWRKTTSNLWKSLAENYPSGGI